MDATCNRMDTWEPDRERYRTLLVVSACLDHRRGLFRILEELNVEAVVCSNLSDAREVLCRQTTAVVFCDENLPDGTYRDLLARRNPGLRIPPIVVIVQSGEWDKYLEAMRSGVFDAIRHPFTPTDVELVIIHALRTQDHEAASAVAAGHQGGQYERAR
ncbi:MAG TPA: hypothetical protein VEG64_08230 [Candidatus Sulfotelmatobacter sp.]|nr:hypothetical protein [Candidatus Sulfotelmatobacter sp.]